MATRSRIGLKLSDGSILSARHHWDGYPEWLGKTLVREFNSYEKVSELIDGGDMSSCVSLGDNNNPGPEYYSLRGEDCPPRLDKDLFEFLYNGEEFAYVFDNNPGQLYDCHEFDDEDPEVERFLSND